MDTHKNNEKMVMSGMFLPYEMIFEILSWLPIKSLLRFKCVCKVWSSTIEDPVFIIKHEEQARFEAVYEKGTKFKGIVTVMGITLEKHYLNNTYRLRNRATRQILDLPSAGQRKGICTSICYIKPTNELKVLYINSSERGTTKVLTYNVLRIGTDFRWKRLDSPLTQVRNVPPSVWPTSRVIDSVFYNIRLGNGLYIDCLDLENESIIGTNIPPHLFYKWNDVWSINWKGKLSLARIEQEQLNIWVLENYRNPKWSDNKIVISLRFLIDNLSPRISIKDIIPYEVEDNLVYWRRRRDYYQLLSFDTQSKEVKYLTPLSTKLVCIYKPSLLPLPFKVEHPRRQIEETQGTSLLFKFMRGLSHCLIGAW